VFQGISFNAGELVGEKQKFAYLADLNEIKANGFNLNIPRYVDTFREKAPINLTTVINEREGINRQLAIWKLK